MTNLAKIAIADTQEVLRLLRIGLEDETDSPDPFTDDDISALAMQEPLPPNHSFMLPAEEQPTESEL